MHRAVDNLDAHLRQNRSRSLESRNPPLEIPLIRVVRLMPAIAPVPVDTAGVRHVEADQEDTFRWPPLDSQIKSLKPRIAARADSADTVQSKAVHLDVDVNSSNIRMISKTVTNIA